VHAAPLGPLRPLSQLASFVILFKQAIEISENLVSRAVCSSLIRFRRFRQISAIVLCFPTEHGEAVSCNTTHVCSQWLGLLPARAVGHVVTRNHAYEADLWFTTNPYEVTRFAAIVACQGFLLLLVLHCWLLMLMLMER
jgi:hypothetical protein